jgi:hypothetical protein
MVVRMGAADWPVAASQAMNDACRAPCRAESRPGRRGHSDVSRTGSANLFAGLRCWAPDNGTAPRPEERQAGQLKAVGAGRSGLAFSRGEMLMDNQDAEGVADLRSLRPARAAVERGGRLGGAGRQADWGKETCVPPS